MLRTCVLIVEDERLLQKAIGISLRREGYEVIEAMTGAEAWNVLHVSSIDILILDVGLPDYDGLELLKEIRAIYPRIPAIVMTAYDAPELESRAIEAGASVFLTKPIVLRALKVEIQKVRENRDRE